MPRTLTQNKEIKDKRKELIIETSAALFCLYGYDNIVIDDIASKLKCSHGLIYHYFKNKDAILVDICKKALNIFVNKLDLSNFKDLKGIEKFIKVHEVLCSSIKESSTSRYYLYMFLTIPTNKKISADIKKNFEYFYKSFEIVINEAKKDGYFKSLDTKQTVFAYLNYIIGTLYSCIKNKNAVKVFDENYILDLLGGRL